LKYPESNGSPELRERIAQFHGVAAQQVMVTNGGSEANYTALWGLLEKGRPYGRHAAQYLQNWGLASCIRQNCKRFYLVERMEGARMRWALDVDSLKRSVTSKTRMIVVTNPITRRGPFSRNRDGRDYSCCPQGQSVAFGG